MSSLRKDLLIVVLSLFSAVLIGGCNTTKGVGKDIERAGEKIQEKASR